MRGEEPLRCKKSVRSQKPVRREEPLRCKESMRGAKTRAIHVRGKEPVQPLRGEKPV